MSHSILPVDEPIYTKMALTKAQILTMFSSRTTVLPAPGANRHIVVERWHLEVLFSGAAYDGTSTNFGTYYRDGTNAAGVVSLAQSFGSASSIMTGRISQSTSLSTATVNAAVTFGCATADPTDNGGTANGTGMLHVWYRIIDTSI